MSLKKPIGSSRGSAHRYHALCVLSSVALTALAAPALAFDLDSDAPITVNADNARLDDSKGVATYTGDVVVTQQETQLRADQVILYRDENGLSRIEATGSPAHYTQPSGTQGEATDAEALVIIYSAGDSLLTFEQDAEIRQAGNLFRGERIYYDTENRVVTAEGSGGNDGNDGRVEMVIQPRSRQ